jgi:hypothetical protein
LKAGGAFALTSDGRLAKTQPAELMASIVTERLIVRLERDGVVIMGRPQALAHLRVVRGNRTLS